MPFDANLILRDGTVDLVTGETGPVLLTADATGAKVIDLNMNVRPFGGSDGVRHLVCTLVLPIAPTTAYADTLGIEINQSDNLTFGYQTVAYFTHLYSFTRMLPITVTTAFIAGDLADLVTGGVTNDTANIIWMHPDVFTIGARTHILVTMVNATDTFDNATEALTIPGTGRANMNGIGFVEGAPKMGGPGEHFRSFTATKRYIQAYVTVAGASNWGKVSIFLSAAPYRKL